MTDRHLTDRHLTDRHVTDHHVTDHHLTDRHVTDHHVTDRHLTDRHLTDRHLTDRHLTDRHEVTTLAELTSLYGEPLEVALTKEIDHISALHRAYIEASPFLVLATSGPDGLDCSPRGDPAGFVRVADERTLLMADRRGNNRLDSLRNIVTDPRVALLFLVPGVGVTLRVNGRARLLTDPDLRAGFAIDGKLPATVIEVTAERVYTQCPKALIRGKLWDPGEFRSPDQLPTVGQIMAAITAGAFDGEAYDAAYPQRISETIY